MQDLHTHNRVMGHRYTLWAMNTYTSRAGIKRNQSAIDQSAHYYGCVPQAYKLPDGGTYNQMLTAHSLVYLCAYGKYSTVIAFHRHKANNFLHSSRMVVSGLLFASGSCEHTTHASSDYIGTSELAPFLDISTYTCI